MAGRRQGRGARVVAWTLMCAALLVLLAACSAGSDGSGGANYNVGLAGSTLDHPSNPPTIAPNGPDGTFAFVYDNQIWLRRGGQTTAKQITRLPLSNGAYIAWGPLIWSPQGKYLAFALVQDLSPQPGAPPSSAGPIYYVDTTTCAGDGQYCAVYSAGIGSVYGHTYSWLGENMLVYSSGQGIMLYTLNNPRVWTVRPIRDGQGDTSAIATFGDLQTQGGYLYYTRLDVKLPGARGAVGSAALYQTFLGNVDQLNNLDVHALALKFPDQIGDGSSLGSLGKVYANNAGEYIAGAWQFRRSGSVTQVAVQQVESVDTQSGQVTFSVCTAQAYGYFPSFGTNCGNRQLAKAAPQPWSVHPQLALSKDGKMAFAGDALYLQDTTDKLGPAGWTSPPAWSPDGQTVVITDLVKSVTDANGVTRAQTDLVAYALGQQAAGVTLIEGARNLAWSPASG
jgi:hypothetical protein